MTYAAGDLVVRYDPATDTSGSFAWSGVPAGDLWFLVVGDSGTNEGSWGDATAGPRKGTTASGVCGTTSRVNSGACP